MARTNYQFERRQRDLAKKKKQEEKRLRKLAGKARPDDGAPGTPGDEQQPGVAPAQPGTTSDD